MHRATGDGDFAQHVVCVGPAAIPSHESPEVAVRLLVERGYDACEIDFGGGFWMDWDYAECLGVLAREAGVALSVHAPLAAFLGHAEHGWLKHHMAIGMLDHSAGIAAACGAAPVVIHPGFLLGREREQASPAAVIAESPDEAANQTIRTVLQRAPTGTCHP